MTRFPLHDRCRQGSPAPRAPAWLQDNHCCLGRPAAGKAAAMLAAQLGESHPYVAELALGVTHDGGLGGCDDDVEFAFALDAILDILERRRDDDSAASRKENP